MKIAIGCDPNAQEAKEKIIQYIEDRGYGEKSNRTYYKKDSSY